MQYVIGRRADGPSRNDHVEVASLLIACGAPVDARWPGQWRRSLHGATQLHMVAFRGHCSISRLFISCGADFAARFNEQRLGAVRMGRLSLKPTAP